MLNPLDVIWIFDNLIDPPHPKMVACVNPADGVFYRINSRPFLKPNIPLPKTPHHEWLDHDSYLHIDPLVLDDYIVGEALKRGGVIGAVSPLLSRDIKRLTLDVRYMTLAEKQAICACLP
jgi:hypothetical protein